jgi:hypothetical protein
MTISRDLALIPPEPDVKSVRRYTRNVVPARRKSASVDGPDESG